MLWQHCCNMRKGKGWLSRRSTLKFKQAQAHPHPPPHPTHTKKPNLRRLSCISGGETHKRTRKVRLHRNHYRAHDPTSALQTAGHWVGTCSPPVQTVLPSSVSWGWQTHGRLSQCHNSWVKMQSRKVRRSTSLQGGGAGRASSCYPTPPQRRSSRWGSGCGTANFKSQQSLKCLRDDRRLFMS